MLMPVTLRANYKVTLALPITVNLETILGANLPLLFPKLTVYNRTAALGSVMLNLNKTAYWLNQTDADFDGLVITTPYSGAVANGANTVITLGTLTDAIAGNTHELTLTNLGAEDPALISLEITGMIDSSVGANKQIVQNV